MDNLQVHKTKEVLATCRRLKARPIFNVPDSPDNGCASRALLGLCETAVHSAGRRGFPRFMSEAEKDEERLLTGRPWQVSYRTTRMGRYVVARGPLFAKGCRSYARRISDFR